MIQPKPADLVIAFQAASVWTEMRPDLLGSGSTVINGIVVVVFGEGWASFHSLASKIAFWIVSSGEKDRFSKIKWFREIHRFQTIEAGRVPASTPTGGREGNFLTSSQPSRVFTTSPALKVVVRGARSQTFLA
ncbi:unnamed protein product [Brassica napus]|uniref:(rape) hypothetical protein n=1 Tax=Brassica napus TaxID=3708 RepID=A0A816YUY2_BRANA|nr:unnamed protein product [Brassica napus]